MRSGKNRLGVVLLAIFGVVVGLVVMGKLFKLAVFVGAVLLVWKVLFDGGEKHHRPATVALAPPVDVDLGTHLTDLEPDAERARLDRELEQAIAAANAQKQQSLPG